jgi:hypothetical protein
LLIAISIAYLRVWRHARRRKVADFPKKQTIFTERDAADAVFYIQQGKVRLTVVSKIGKEATLGILNEGDFFGEGWPCARRTGRLRTSSRSRWQQECPLSNRISGISVYLGAATS